jgi:hypothetical protein
MVPIMRMVMMVILGMMVSWLTPFDVMEVLGFEEANPPGHRNPQQQSDTQWQPVVRMELHLR